MEQDGIVGLCIYITEKDTFRRADGLWLGMVLYLFWSIQYLNDDMALCFYLGCWTIKLVHS